MGEVRVHRGANDFTTNFPKFFSSFAESDDFSRADEGEVQWIEEKHNIFPCIKESKT